MSKASAVDLPHSTLEHFIKHVSQPIGHSFTTIFIEMLGACYGSQTPTQGFSLGCWGAGTLCKSKGDEKYIKCSFINFCFFTFK